MRACGLLHLLLSVALSSAADEASLHPAEENGFFGYPLSDEDVHQITEEATKLHKEGVRMAAVDKRKQNAKAEAAKRTLKTALLAKLEGAKDTKAPSKLEGKLALQLRDLEDCTKKLRHCLANADVKSTAKATDPHFQSAPEGGPTRLGEGWGPNLALPVVAPEEKADPPPPRQKAVPPVVLPKEDTPPIEFPKTTAQEDWDHDHKGLPYPSRAGSNGNARQDRKTAVERYGTEKEKNDVRDPLEHNSMYEDSVARVGREARELYKNGQHEMNRTATMLHNNVLMRERGAAAAEAAVVDVAAKLEQLGNTASEENSALKKTQNNLKKCRENVKKAC